MKTVVFAPNDREYALICACYKLGPDQVVDARNIKKLLDIHPVPELVVDRVILHRHCRGMSSWYEGGKTWVQTWASRGGLIIRP